MCYEIPKPDVGIYFLYKKSYRKDIVYEMVGKDAFLIQGHCILSVRTFTDSVHRKKCH